MGLRNGGTRWASRRWKRRGVSDVVGTILLLALTVTLFSSIFFFVSTFPAPTPQPVNQFSASLTYDSTGTHIVGVSILHLAGPAVSGNAQVYLYSSRQPSAFTTPFTVSSGLGNAAVWNLGQTWVKDITSYNLVAPDNITVSVVTTSQLLFRVTLPGPQPSTLPTFVNVAISPSQPSVGGAFTISAQIQDTNLKAGSVFVNLSLLPGISGTGLKQMTFSAATGLWSYNVPAGTTTSTGTYYIFVNATDASGLRNSIAFTVTIVATTSSFVATLAANNTAPSVGSAVGLTAYVTAGGTGAAVSVAFTANGAAISTSTGNVPSGSTASFGASWTPTAPGVYLLQALVTSGGATVAGGTLNLSVFPSILFVGHNVPSGTRTTYNESAYLAQELTAAGIPYANLWVACSAALPASTTFNSYGLVIIDFGSTYLGGCPKAPSTTEQAKITGSTSDFLLVGSHAFGLTTCTSYSSAYFALVGAKWASSGTCVTIPNATASVTYTGSGSLLAKGVPSPMTINGTLGSSSSFTPYDYFTLGTAVGGTTWLTAGANVIGTAASGRAIALPTDPALFTSALPNTNSWGTGQAGSAVVYNLVNYLVGLSTSTSPGRALPDYAVTQTTLLGLSHARLTTIYVGVRANGPSASALTVTLLVNGSLALYNGIAVIGTATTSGSGGTAWITLTWVAPANGPFTLSVVLSSSSVTDLYSLNNQMPLSILNQATSFT